MTAISNPSHHSIPFFTLSPLLIFSSASISQPLIDDGSILYTRSPILARSLALASRQTHQHSQGFPPELGLAANG